MLFSSWPLLPFSCFFSVFCLGSTTMLIFSASFLEFCFHLLSFLISFLVCCFLSFLRINIFLGKFDQGRKMFQALASIAAWLALTVVLFILFYYSDIEVENASMLTCISLVGDQADETCECEKNSSKTINFFFSYQLLQGTSKQTSATRRVLGDSRQTNLDQRETLRFKKSVNIALKTLFIS